jgi:predicted RecB family nuclease
MSSSAAAAELTSVKGVGQSVADKLEAAGITTIDDLAEVDLRSADIEGLSSDHVARLRENANRFLQAQDSGELTLVEGLGPSAQEKLEAAGIETIEELSEVDLRSKDVEGLSTENLQKLKRNAKYLLP